MKPLRIRQLNVVDAFSCIGGACQDTCCAGWDVEVDPKTYKHYEGLKASPLKPLFDQSLKALPASERDSQREGYIQMTGSKRCPFLDPSDLCAIHTHHGEGCLSNLCATYPRVYNRIGDALEVTLSLSCPEVARLVLMGDQSLHWVKATQRPKRWLLSTHFDPKAKHLVDHPGRYYFRIRQTSVHILQNRAIALPKRLILLGQYFEALNQSVEASGNRQIVECSKHYQGRTTIPTKEAYDHYGPFKAYYELQWACRFSLEHAMEHYLVALIYKNAFPFTQSDYLFMEYGVLLHRFEQVIEALMANVSKGEEVSKEAFIDCVQKLSKQSDHEADSYKNYFNDMKRLNPKNSLDILLG